MRVLPGHGPGTPVSVSFPIIGPSALGVPEHGKCLHDELQLRRHGVRATAHGARDSGERAARELLRGW